MDTMLVFTCSPNCQKTHVSSEVSLYNHLGLSGSFCGCACWISGPHKIPTFPPVLSGGPQWQGTYAHK